MKKRRLETFEKLMNSVILKKALEGKPRKNLGDPSFESLRSFRHPAGLAGFSNVLALFIVMITVIGCFSIFIEAGDTSLKKYLPASSELPEWSLSYEPQEAAGDDLYLLINGGAEIYHEYGFKRALIAELANSRGNKINVEMYEMSGPESAYGIYTFKSSGNGRRVDVGDGGMLEAYYLNFWKGSFQVSLTILVDSDEMRQEIIKIGNIISGKIKSGGEPPSIMNLLPTAQLQFSKYLKGYLSLINTYDLHVGDIFEIKEGAVGFYPDMKILIIKNDWLLPGSEQNLENAKISFASSDSYKNVIHTPTGLILTDLKSNKIMVEQCSDYIIITIDQGGSRADEFRELIEQKILKSGSQ